jgi:hypothetical protein
MKELQYGYRTLVATNSNALKNSSQSNDQLKTSLSQMNTSMNDIKEKLKKNTVYFK